MRTLVRMRTLATFCNYDGHESEEYLSAPFGKGNKRKKTATKKKTGTA